jgi:hypothetical protein
MEVVDSERREYTAITDTQPLEKMMCDFVFD